MALEKPTNLVRLNLWISRHHAFLAAMFILGFLISGIATLHLYGISWDEGLGDFFFGERYLFYLTTFQDKYLDFNADLSRLKDLPLQLFLSPFRIYPYEFPALADIFAAISMHLFGYRLGWLDPVDAFHLFSVMLTSLFLFVLYIFFSQRTNKLSAFFAVVFLAAFPRLWGDMHFNPKDVPVMVLIGFVIMAYLTWYEKPRLAGAVLAGFLFGCGVAIKANAVFTPFIILLGIWPLKIDTVTLKSNLNHLKRYFHHYLIMGITSLAVYFLSWPYLYADPMRVLDHVRYIVTQGGRTAPPGWSLDPLLQVITTMPEVMFLFLCLGLYFSFSQKMMSRKPVLRLFLAWMIIPILRISLPGMVNFGGIRHFLEFLPAAGLLAGWGAASLVERLAKQDPAKNILAAMSVLLLLTINTAWIASRFHPYQYIYYNSLAGGLNGAARRFEPSEATDYWAVSYRQGLEWLNRTTTGDQNLYVPVAEWLVRLPERIWLRPGILLVDQQQARSMLDESKPVYVMILNNPDFYDEIAETCVTQFQPAYQIIVDGKPILFIYHLNPQGS